MPADVVEAGIRRKPAVMEEDERYKTCLGPAPELSRGAACVRFLIALFHTSLTFFAEMYDIHTLMINLFHVVVVYALCRGAYGEIRQALLAYCLLEVIFVVKVSSEVFTLFHVFLSRKDESYVATTIAILVLIASPAISYAYFYRIIYRHYLYLLDRDGPLSSDRALQEYIIEIEEEPLCKTKRKE
ncbi:hypothetical protein PFISCL1PPCAC_4556 [Pristionchus fissidentatus]|uniref:Uncharacterized protein n=1 Tax=Pristionchus fissidentatus TaxID=1538716 RepID=A0AAV5V3Z1_9BILA|nr:hypothetical protein PFISCL1PPCAC_4556 [Pristionchus fissidentatus]